jgi:GGDEF domain-containing protein
LIRSDQSSSQACNIDEDTGLLNCEAFLDCVEKEIERARRFGDCAAVCLLDVSDHGAPSASYPLATERLIRRVAGVMSSCFRKIDILGRFDDTTLAVLLGRTTSMNAPVICSRMQSGLQSRFRDDPSIRATISCHFLDLNGSTSVANDGIGDMLGAFDLARQQNDAHQLHSSPATATN